MRSFVYCEDVAEAFDTILHKGAIGETYNIGTEFEISNKEVTKTLLRIMKPDIADPETEIVYVRDRAINDKRYWVNYEKIAALVITCVSSLCLALGLTLIHSLGLGSEDSV